MEQLYDLTGGDKARMNIYIATYRETIAENLLILRDALNSVDLERIKKIVHQSKPLFTMLGFAEIYNLADEIENHIEMSESEDIILIKSEHLMLKMAKSLESLMEFPV